MCKGKSDTKNDNPFRFVSLSQARDFRDKRADWIVHDLETYLGMENARVKVDAICCMGRDARGVLRPAYKDMFHMWNGEGFPPGYLIVEEFEAAIEWIAKREREEVAELLKAQRRPWWRKVLELIRKIKKAKS